MLSCMPKWMRSIAIKRTRIRTALKVAMQQMAVEGQPDKMMSDTEAWMKHSSTWKKKNCTH